MPPHPLYRPRQVDSDRFAARAEGLRGANVRAAKRLLCVTVADATLDPRPFRPELLV